MKYLENPNLPKDNVTTVIASGEISLESEYMLNSFGIDVIKTKPHRKLYNAVAYHPDMQLHHIGHNNVICDSEAIITANQIFDTENICSGNDIENKYPYDIRYNAARVGQFLVCNRDFTDKNIIEDAETKGLEIIAVKQGYAKCNLCIVNENAVITSDKGIKSALVNFPIDVLFVEDDSILLKDLSHGFIGGSTGKIAPDKLVINGNIIFHKNYSEILDFTKKHNVEIISLNNNFIEDIGSILPILEK
ncbi:MAG: hypothetical protein UIM24_00685 [Clostridia bacterium]|nr:hypothetical protein [Clostridia bacterium]